ncbi:MAG: hypothetical protein IJO76_04865 [Clostridia bacterium]|nr:hypothetical protein [Clostridia bacterium]
MKKAISCFLVVVCLLMVFSGCSKEPISALELIESGYYNGYAVLVFQNNSGKTITSVEGGVYLWSSNDVRLGHSSFYWNDTCDAGETLEVKLKINADGYVDRVGYTINSINNGQIEEYL